MQYRWNKSLNYFNCQALIIKTSDIWSSHLNVKNVFIRSITFEININLHKELNPTCCCHTP